MGYHIYRDETDFDYEVKLARADVTTNKNERYILKVCASPNICFHLSPPYPVLVVVRSHTQGWQLYESHTEPHMYATYVRYSSASGRKVGSDIRAPVGSTFEEALVAFKKFFKTKTCRTWEQRLDKMKLEEDAFVYGPPKLGWPRGRMPQGWEGPIDHTEATGDGETQGM